MAPVMSGSLLPLGGLTAGDSVWILAAVAALAGLVALHYQRRFLRGAAQAAARDREAETLARRATHAEAENLRLAGLLAAATVPPAEPPPAPAGDPAPSSPGLPPETLARLLDPLVRQIVAGSAGCSPSSSLRQGLPLLQETTARAFLLSRGVTAAVDAAPGFGWHSLNTLVTADVERRRAGHDPLTRLAVFLEPGLPVLPLAAEAVVRVLECAAPALPAGSAIRSVRIRTSFTSTDAGPAQRLEIALATGDPAAPSGTAPSTESLLAAAGAGAVVTVEPATGGWTAVILWPSPEKPALVPAAIPAAPGAATPEPRPSPSPAAGRRVLLAEDDPFVARGVSAALRRGGHRVTNATDGTSALALLRLDPAGYDVVFTDLNMPGVGGRDLLVALNRDGVKVPVVVLSGYITSAIFDELQQLGVARILRKPVRIEDLLAAVEQPRDQFDPAEATA
jgi:CheY-like chemotaxis protein